MSLNIKNGRRKSFDIEFVEVNEENMKEVATWCGGIVTGEEDTPYIKILDKNAVHTQQTKAFVGDMVVHSLDTHTFKKFTQKAFANIFVVDESKGLPGSTDDVAEHYRSAKSGEYVSEEYAKENPDITVKETDELPRDAGLA